MTNTLTSPQVDKILGRLFAAAALDEEAAEPELPSGLTSWAQASAAQRSAAYAGQYLPVSAEAGQLLYLLARAIRPRTVVEFGTSYGISTIYLAAAVTAAGDSGRRPAPGTTAVGRSR